MRSQSLLVALSVAACCCCSAANKPSPDDPAPPLNLEKLLQAPPGAVATWDALKGKIVILEFWATWCGPCIEAVPHLNELAEEFKDEPVQFIAITDEKESVVTPFLKRKPMRAWIGLDTDRSMFDDYGIGGIPHTVLVGSNGVIAAITHPVSLSATHIRNVLAGKSAGLPKPNRDERRVAAEASETRVPPAVFEVLIRPSEIEEAGSSSSSGPGETTPLGKMYGAKAQGSTVMNLALWAFKTTETRLVTNSILPEGKFDVVINVPYDASDRIPELLAAALRTTFGLAARKEQRQLDVYVLTAKNSKLEPTVSTGGSSSSSRPGQVSAVNVPISNLAWYLENKLRQPVFDETGLTNRYDYQLKWQESELENSSREILTQALREQLGLELTATNRLVEVVVVDLEKNSK